MPAMSRGTILFNPVSTVHYRNISIFQERMPGWKIRKLINPRMPWFSGRIPSEEEAQFSRSGSLPEKVFDDVKAVVVFSAQPRVPSAGLISAAALEGIPVLAVEEVLQMMLEQGYVNEYFLPVDRLFAGSEYERKGFIDFGVPADSVEAAGRVFGQVKSEVTDPRKRSWLVDKLGLDGTKKVAVLSLAYQTPSGETLEIRKQLIGTVARGLPGEYELVVKPHPAEQDIQVGRFIKEVAPSAKVADRFTPIGDVLSIADVLFNRGNSQVIIDAFNRKIPVVVVPVGRKTFFHGVFDEVIADSKKGVADALRTISEKGFAAYEPLIRLYSGASPEDAAKRAVDGILDAALGGRLFEREERLADLSVYWSWMGYSGRSKVLLDEARKKLDREVCEALERLELSRASEADMEILRGWGSRRYRLWLLQSMRIKQLFISGARIGGAEAQWLADYPPRMNREYFVDYTSMLLWCLLRSGMKEEYNGILGKIYGEYSHLKCVNDLKKSGSEGCGILDCGYWRMRARSAVKYR